MPRKKKIETTEVTDGSASDRAVATSSVDGPAKSPKRMDFVYLSPDDLVPSPWNANEQDELTFNRLVDEINEVGFIDPVTVVPLSDGKYRILGGEHRWRAAQVIGMEKIPVTILSEEKWNDEDLQKLVSVRANVLHGKMNPEKFMRLYEEMASKYGADAVQSLMGYTDTAGFQKLIGSVKKGLKQSLPKEMHGEIEKATKEAKSVEDLSRIIQELFNRHGDTLALGYMVFVYGKQTHFYLRMNAKMRRVMQKVDEYCRLTKEDINDFLVPLSEAWMRAAVTKLDQAKENKADEGVATEGPGW